MKKMIVAQMTKPGEPFELVERDVPQPGHGQVRVRVLSCGLCYSDRYVKNNSLVLLASNYPCACRDKRDCGSHWRAGIECRGLGERPAHWNRLAWRQLQSLPAMPQWRSHEPRPP